MIARGVMAALALFTSVAALAEQPSNDDLIKSCDQKTIVVNKQGERVGEKLAGSCSAYLQATAHAFLNARPACKVDADKQQPDYLFSVFRTYVHEKKVDGSENASATLLEAFARAFDCK